MQHAILVMNIITFFQAKAEAKKEEILTVILL